MVNDDYIYVPIARLGEVDDNRIKDVRIGSQRLVLCRQRDEYFVLDGVCSHAGGPLCRGEIDGAVLVCPWHGWEFDLRSGVCEIEPTLRQQTYQVRIDGEEIQVAVPRAMVADTP